MRWFLGFLLLLTPLAYSEDEAQRTAFSEGRYQDAVALSIDVETADNFAFAARSLLAEAMSAPEQVPPQSTIIAAELKARQALEIDPAHIEGRLQLAIALSLRARPLSNRAAMRSGYGDEAKALVLSVLEDDPSNHYAHGFMAVWNIEVVRRGGGFGASIMGASVKKGRKHYEAAISQRGASPATHWQYARALASLNPRKYRTEIEDSLRAAITSKAPTKLEFLMQDRARILDFEMKRLSNKDIKILAANML